MKHIVKDQNTPLFDKWKTSANEDWQPTYDDLRGEEKKEVKDSLMKEQGYICCYCERRLIDEDSHIEHFNPQNNNDAHPLDYANLLCSCQQNLAQGEPRHCGNLKGGWFDDKCLVSPLDSDCGGRFAYLANGKIIPARESDGIARMTIEKVGLGINKLNALREKAIEPFLDEGLDEQEVSQFVDGYLRKNSGEMFGEFWTTINYIFVQNVQ